MKKTLLLMALLSFTFMNAQVTLYSEDFESYTPTDNVGEQTDVPAGFINYDNDGDSIGWGLSNPANFNQPFGDIYQGNNFITSASYVTTGANGNGGNGALSPDNILVLPMVSIPAGATDVNLSYFVGSGTDPSYFSENYSVQVTSSSDLASILAATPVLDTTLAFQGGEVVTINLDAFIGQDVYISFRHYNTTDEWLIGLDDIAVTAATVSAVGDNEIANFNYFVKDNSLNMSASNDFASISIYDVTGKKVLNQNLNSSNESISLNVTDGIYIAKVTTVDNKVKTFKFIVR